MSNVMVQIEGLSKTYFGGRVAALREVDLCVERGAFVSVLGVSGSGKTTLLNIIGALDTPTRGRVCVDGSDVSSISNLDRFRAQKVGFVFQLHNLIPTLNAFENVQLPMCAAGMKPQDRKRRAAELLEAVGLKDRLYHRPAMLSGGERQRVAIARAVANNPPLVLGDEPTGTLDAATGEEIVDLLCHLNREMGATLIIVTHDANLARTADRVVRLGNGMILPNGAETDVLDTATARV